MFQQSYGRMNRLKERYSRNLGALSEEENQKLRKKSVCIVGCGGLGGYIFELLLRIGVGRITVIDGDCFEESNLNRQLLSNENVIGHSKADEMYRHAQEVNRDVAVTAVSEFLTEENAESLLADHDIVIDAVDNIAARKIMGRVCGELGIPLIYGAIKEWYAQISLIMPGSEMLNILYQDHVKLTDKSSLSFTPAVCASFQTAEAVKYLCGRECVLADKILYVDLISMETELISVK